MDIDKLFHAGMRTCGRVLKVLPKEDIQSPLLYMQGVLRDETLPKINQLLPILITKTFPIYALKKMAEGDMTTDMPTMDARYLAFRVPSSLVDGGTLCGIKKIIQAYQTNDHDHDNVSAYGYNKWGRMSSDYMYGRSWMTVLNYADGQLQGTMKAAIRAKFYHPNILWVNRPYAENENLFVTVTFKIANDEQLVSVSDSAYQTVRELFVLDLKASIFNEFGMFSEMDTPNGAAFNLRIDDWSGAEAEANEKFKEYQATMHFRNESMHSG